MNSSKNLSHQVQGEEVVARTLSLCASQNRPKSEKNLTITTHAPSKAVMTVDEFCLEYGIGRTSAYAELKAGRLKAKKRGDTTLISRQSADQWFQGLPDYLPRRETGVAAT